jgi:hypothetical protein
MHLGKFLKCLEGHILQQLASASPEPRLQAYFRQGVSGRGDDKIVVPVPAYDSATAFMVMWSSTDNAVFGFTTGAAAVSKAVST